MIKNTYKILVFLLLLIFMSSCFFNDPLFEIRRLSRSGDILKKEQAAEDYKLAVDTLVKSYISLGSLNKDVGRRLMMAENYTNAIKHFNIAKDIRNKDTELYYWLGVCYVNLYKIEKKDNYLMEAEKNYQISLNINPGSLDALYAYAHLSVYGTQNYQKALDLLNEYIYGVSPKLMSKVEASKAKGKNFVNPKLKNPDPNAYFLLARVYYLLEDYQKSYDIYNEIYKFKDKLNKEQKNKLDEFILETRRKIQGE